MTTTSFRLAAAGIAALLGLSLTAAPSDAATVSPSPTAETGELVPAHAGHDHGKAKDDKKAEKSEKSSKKGKKKGKCGKGHHKADGHDHDHACH
jgi:hypothetical protein